MISNDELVKTLKDGGFIKQKQKDYYSIRIRVVAGNITSEQMRKVSELAEKYGRGYVTFTVRLGIEIPWVHYSKLQEVKEEVERIGLAMAGCGPRVRPIVACKGTVCPYGLIDTQGLAKKLDDEFFPTPGFPHKFKMGISGCPNNCTKPQFNDIGFQGQVEPELNEDLCTGCGLCADVCDVKAITIKDNLARRDDDKCIYCGSCIRVCPMDAWKRKRSGVAVFVGGKFGKKYNFGYHIADLVDVEKIPNIIEKTMNFYKSNGISKERLYDTINRIGLENFKKEILEDENIK
ncbi:4Fe-4S binding protein [Thermoanaerobacterium thermosaccharolyticum]|uniref:4Fe-4S binding protein n=1 Tax=Thermoanaerobacterium thermosaccharolyticum TaxID=1517 RepID=UPI003D2A4F02